MTRLRLPCPARGLALPVALVLLAACGERGTTAAPAETPPGEVAARIGDETITVGEVDAWLKDEWFRSRTEGDPVQTWELRREGLDRLVDQRLLEGEAERRGVGPGALLEAEVAARVSVDEAAIRTFYEQNEDRLGGSYEELGPRIRSHLEAEQARAARGAFLETLRRAAAVERELEPPRRPVAATGPAKGPEDAPVTIVEFSDYQCPFCRRTEPTIQRVLDRYGERVRLVYRHFPLDDIHPRAREAAACAEEQGRFWEYHDRLFAEGAELHDEALRLHAEAAGLDPDAFRTCMGEDRTAEQVQRDVAAGKAAGVRGTPAFFVNGIPLTGARPFEDFVELIELELESAAGDAGAGAS